MKILKISGQGIASLYDRFEVDLEQGPLADNGLFAVTGRTGTGKSTILDVMCLALYHQAARYQGVRDKKTLDQSDMYNNIMSRGANVCAAELEFIGVNGVRYRAVWGLRRIKTRNGEPRFENSGCDLSSWSDSLGWQKIDYSGLKGLLKAKTESIGLDYSQFTRVVLLPQGQFTSFLTAEPKDRTGILNGIADTELYKLISKVTFEEYKGLRDKKEDLENRQQSLKLLSPLERQELKTKRQTATQEWEALQAKLNLLTKYQELHTKYENEQIAATKLKAELEATKVAFGPKIKKLEIFERESEARANLQKLMDTQEQLDLNKKRALEVEQKLNQLNQQNELATTQLTEAKEHQEALQKERTELEPTLNKARELEATLAEKQKLLQSEQQKLKEECEALTKVAQSYNAAQNEHEIAQKELAQVQAQNNRLAKFNELSPALELLKEALQTFLAKSELYTKVKNEDELARQAQAQNTQDLARLTAELKRLEASKQPVATVAQTLAKCTQEYTLANDKCHLADQIVTQARTTVKDLDTLKRDFLVATEQEHQLASYKSEQEELSQKLAVVTQEVARYKREYEQCQEITALKRQILNLSDLRATLKPDQVCPLCGATHHPFVENADTLVEPSEVNIAKARENQCLERLEAKQRQETTCQTNLANVKSLLEKATKKQVAIESELLDSWRNFCGTVISLEALRMQDLARSIEGNDLPMMESWAQEVELFGAALNTKTLTIEASLSAVKQMLATQSAIETKFEVAREALTTFGKQQVTTLKTLKKNCDTLKVSVDKAQSAQNTLETFNEDAKKIQECQNRCQLELTKAQNNIALNAQKMDNWVKDGRELLMKISGILGPYYPEIELLKIQIDQALAPEVFNLSATTKLLNLVTRSVQDINHALNLASELTKATQKEEHTRLKAEQLEGALTEKQSAYTKFEQKVQTYQAEFNQMQQERAQLLGGRVVAVVEKQYADHIKAATKQLEEIRARANDVKTKQTDVSGQQKILQKTSSELTVKAQHLTDIWAQDVKKIGLDAEQLAAILLLDNQTRTDLGQKRQLLQDLAQKTEIKANLLAQAQAECLGQAKLIEPQYWEEREASNDERILGAQEHTGVPTLKSQALSELEDSLKNKSLEVDELKNILAVDDDHVKTNGQIEAELSALKPELELKRSLSELIGSADGSKFCNIAQGITLYTLTERANNYLNILRPRYSLTVGEDGHEGLLLSVIDHDCADTERSVLSLSGGEKFLVSLALALGLSDMTCGGTVVQSLFIDEGFDCVDTESLNVVLDALGQLQRGARTLGIISHVEMLAKSVPVRVKVTAVSDGRSRIEVD